MNEKRPFKSPLGPGLKYEPVSARSYRCRCGRPVFFRNTVCLACHTPLGYDAALSKVIPLDAVPNQAGLFVQAGASPPPDQTYVRCANAEGPARCNWLVPGSQADQGATLCQSCRLNRTIPDLSFAENGELWGRLEMAKRRLVSQLIAMRLPVASKIEDPARGLAYDFLRSLPGAPKVMTGHDCGLITINLEEADDPTREHTRKSMGEPYRTLLGHFRHEVGHYYWDRLVFHSDWLMPYRALFGDERQNYNEAVKAHYRDGAPLNWGEHFVSAYASAHPWEDWAETWAHYLHMVDTADTAASFGIDLTQRELETEPFGPELLWRQDDGEGDTFLALVNDWVGLTAVMNEMSRSMGQPDFYPFVLSREVITKLHFIHCVIHSDHNDRFSLASEACCSTQPAPNVLPVDAPTSISTFQTI